MTKYVVTIDSDDNDKLTLLGVYTDDELKINLHSDNGEPVSGLRKENDSDDNEEMNFEKEKGKEEGEKIDYIPDPSTTRQNNSLVFNEKRRINKIENEKPDKKALFPKGGGRKSRKKKQTRKKQTRKKLKSH
jgi:hypothetical protein